MKIQWREDIVNPVLCFNANCSAIRKLRQTLKQHQHLWFANPPKQTNRPSTMRIFHEFPWISTAKTHHFIRPHLFGGMDFFFPSSTQYSMQLLSGHLFKVPFGVVARGWRKGKNGLIPRPKSPKVSWVVYLLHFSGWCSTIEAFSNLFSFWGQWLMIIGGLVSKDQLVFVYCIFLICWPQMALRHLKVLALYHLALSLIPVHAGRQAASWWPTKTGKLHRCSGPYVKDGRRPEWYNEACKEFSTYQTSKT